LYLPWWSIDLLRRKRTGQLRSNGRRSGKDDHAIVLTTDTHGRAIVARRCERSEAAGVCEGMDVAHARALLARDRIIIERHEPEREATALRGLARWAIRFTPTVTADLPDGVLLDVSGCERLYGDEPTLMRTVVEGVMELGFQVRAALAPTVGAAWALARYGSDGTIVRHETELKAAISPLPIQALRLDEAVREALAEVAIDKVAHLLALPRASLVARFGESLLLRVDQAMGQAFEPIAPLRATESVQVERCFDGPVLQMEAIVLTVRELLAELSAMLRGHESGARRIVLTLDRVDIGAVSEGIHLSHPTRHAKHLWALFSPVVEQMNLGYGVERVSLAVTHVARLRHEQAGQWRTEGDSSTCTGMDESIGQLMDRLTARMGPQHVRRIEAVASHVPERSFRTSPASQAVRVRKMGERSSQAMPDRPTVLYDQPMRAHVVLLSPDGPVMSMRMGGDPHRVIESVGPERIRLPWWDGHGANPFESLARDYFKVQDEAGVWWWIFREVEAGDWFIHGRWS
jgi:protein ImuB